MLAGRSERRLVCGMTAFALLASGQAALAQRYTLDLDDIHVTLVDATGQAQTIDLGDVSVTLSNRGGSGMSAVFRVDEQHRPNHGGDAIWEHLELHWVNIIREDDCPATVRGIPAGRSSLPFPIIDMPRNGWDYVYKHRRASRGRGPERSESNADGAEMLDDARDIWPWYHTPEEESMDRESGNGGGGFGQFRQGVVYGIRDLPSLCDNHGLTAFTAFLVGVVPTGAETGGLGTLEQGQLLLLAGFDWDWTTRGLRLAPTEMTIDEFDRALHNGQFPEWSGADDVAVFVQTLGSEGEVGVAESGADRASDQPGTPTEREQETPRPRNQSGLKPKP